MQSFPSDVPKWKIVRDIGGSFRWTQVYFDSPLQKPVKALDSHREVLAVRFPSVKDFLHEVVESKTGLGKSGLIDEKGGVVPMSLTGREKKVESMVEGVRDSGVVPMFRVGLGRAVGLRKNSSIQKTASNFRKDEVGDGQEGLGAAFGFRIGGESRSELGELEFDGVMNGGSRINCGNPTFRMASGRSVSVKVSSLRKAACILEEHESTTKDDDDAVLTRQKEVLSSTFRSRESSFNKATPSVPRGEDMATRGLGFPCDGETNYGGFTMFKSGSGKSISIKQSSIYKGASILQENITERGLESPCHRNTSGGFLRFQTGSGNPVSHKEPSFNKAVSICEESISNRVTYQGNAGAGFPMFHTGSGKSVSIKQSSIKKAVSILGETINGDMYVSQDQPVEDLHKALQYSMLAAGSSSSSVEFHNTSDRSLLISHDALQRARGLLGESVSGAEETTSLLSLNQNIHKNISLPSARSITQLPYERKHQSSIFNGDCKGLESTRATLQGRPSVMPLKDVSNTINVNMSSEKCFGGEKRRSGTKHYPSPFKKPRSSRPCTFLSSSPSAVSIGSFKPPVSKDCCRKPRISTCYPFKSKKKTLMEFLLEGHL